MYIENQNTEKVKFKVSVFPGYVQIRSPFKWKRSPGKRGKVKGYSRDSHRRLKKTLFSVSEYPTHFISLTYPGEFPKDPRKWKRDLDVFGKALLREFPGTCDIWKLEPQKRGAPHFHLLVWLRNNKKSYWELCKWVSETWYRVVGSGDKKHLDAGTNVIDIEYQCRKNKKSKRKILMLYVSKYFSKEFLKNDLPLCWQYPGRFWGVHGRENFPRSSLLYNADFKVDEFIQLRRFVKRWLRSIGRKSKLKKKVKSMNRFIKFLSNALSFTVFIPAEPLIRFLLSLRSSGFCLSFPDFDEDLLFCF